ncbi:MAG TPA: pirin family protein [Acidimicrobiales bacterium]|nr:pirin family protein [Acidimicrobiales bacterium]
MSGPVADADVAPVVERAEAAEPTLEITESRLARVGSVQVRRALPRRQRRTVGAWCFVDHMGPMTVSDDTGMDIGPHPHMGLQTVTWLLAGEIEHHDSLGSEQVIRPGQLNLMSAGFGIAHAEERTGHYRGEMEGVQLWVAQPEATRNGAGEFEHHPELPRVDLGGGIATVLVGEFEEAVSPARRDTDLVGIELDLLAGVELPLRPTYEYALVVLDGQMMLGEQAISPGHLAYLGEGRDEIGLPASGGRARALLLGGVPFDEPLLMWWNFVGRSREEFEVAYRDWAEDGGRFGAVRSGVPRVIGSPPMWSR